MSYFAEDTLFRRRVPHYTPLPLRLVDVRLEFKAADHSIFNMLVDER